MNKKSLKVFLSFTKLIVLLIIAIGIPIYLYIYHKDFIMGFKSIDDLVKFLQHYKLESIFVYIGLQVLQVVISVIPGQAFQFVAGYLYRFLPGLVFSVIGAAIGTFVSFYLAKVLGRDGVHLIVGEKRTKEYLAKLNRKRAYTIVFILYLVPGIPKDILSYIAGVSDMKFKAFWVLSLLGRLPAMAINVIIGDLYFRGHYVALGIIAVITIIVFFIFLFNRKKLDKYIDKLYKRLSN